MYSKKKKKRLLHLSTIERTKYMSIVLHEGFIAHLILYLRHEEKG